MTTVLSGRLKGTPIDAPTTAQLVETGTRRLPALKSRLERAEALVLAGHVLPPNGDAPRRVTSQTTSRVYQVHPPEKLCDCYDRTEGNAPHGMCKHILAVAMWDRILEAYPPPPTTDADLLNILVECAQAGYPILI